VKTPRFCAYCGALLALRRHVNELPARLTCASCQTIEYDSPSLLVNAYIFAENRLLLMRRGLAPYQGCWAPPAGYVEAGESVDAAISREVSEEVGLHLPREHYVPLGIISLPSINQVYVSFLVRLERLVELNASYPEALAANWFLEENYPAAEIWEPAMGDDVKWLFALGRSGRFEFFQQTERRLRRLPAFIKPVKDP
jgi:ADP-ribose pyrophosphatase YjhB (NUDIX family)